MQTLEYVPLILSRSLVWLAFALPAVFIFGSDVARALTTERALRNVLGPGIGIAVWLEAVQLLARATSSFFRGLVLATLGMMAVVLTYRLVRRAPPRQTTQTLGPGVGWFALGMVTLVTLPIVPLAFMGSFHDEELYVGHLAMISRIVNDAYPPQNLTFPAFELRYHYGFDLLSACLSAIFRLAPDIAIDVATVGLWAYSALVAYTLGEVWLGRRRGVFAMLLVLFSGGLPICFNGQPFVGLELMGHCVINKAGATPSLLSHFFQHPWGLALPLGLVTILVVTAREHQRTWLRHGVLCVLLSAISISEIVMFVALIPTVVAAEMAYLWSHDRRNRRAWFGIVVASLGALGLAKAMGGFFAPNPAAGLPLQYYFQAGVVSGWTSALRWYAQSYGLIAPLGLVGIAFLPQRARLLAVLLAGGSLFVISFIHHPHSGDDLTWKFGVVAVMTFGLGGARIVSAVFPYRLPSITSRYLGRVVLAGTLVLASMVGALGFMANFIVLQDKATPLYQHTCRNMSRDDFDAMSFLRPLVKPGEIVYRAQAVAPRYSQWAGISVPWLDWATSAFGFSSTLMHKRLAVVQLLPNTPEEYAAEGIVWFVLGPEDKRLGKIVNRWIAARRAHDVQRFGRLRIVKLDVGKPMSSVK